MTEIPDDDKAREFADLAARAWKIADDPPPMTTVSGQLVVDEHTGEPYPDRMAQLEALKTLLAINRARRDLAKPSYGTLDDLRAEVERRKKELGEAGDGGNT